MKTGVLKFIIFLGLSISSMAIGYAQTGDQKALEQKRNDLLEEIKQIQVLLKEQGSERKSLVTEMEMIQKKIAIKEQLNRVTNQQINVLNTQIKKNQAQIQTLEDELVVLKASYAKMIRKSYKNRSQQNRLMFVLSSESFMQAYKRLEYMRQYKAHLEKQGTLIKQKTAELNTLNNSLVTQRKDKETLIDENRAIKKDLEEEKSQQQTMIAAVKKKEGDYVSQIKTKQKEADDLDKEIQRLIKEAIAESRRKAQANGAKVSESKNTFALTPEEKMIADNFAANKGRLIWPVERGVVSLGYGKHADPVYPDIVQDNTGVNIVTNEGGDARAVFDGEVTEIAVVNNKAMVYVRHGNYITTYCNLTTIYVKKGDKVKAKQALGRIFTNKHTGKTEMKFVLYKNTTKLNPELWIAKM